MSNFPPRPNNALPASQFFSKIGIKNTGNRDQLISNEILRGNFPNFMRKLVPIIIKDNNNNLTYNVMPDYLCLGSEEDFIRVPIGATAAQKIADAFGCILPTAKMSDQIWKQAKTKVKPNPLSGQTSTLNGKSYSPEQFIKEKLSDTDSFIEHNRQIQNQLNQHRSGDLVAGHKKDLVLSQHVATDPNRASIYGMHDASGKAIQGNSWIHSINYNDYSSGIRLVDKQAILNGKQVNLGNILQDPSLSYLISNEGPLKSISYQKETNKPATNIEGRKSIIDRVSEYMDKIIGPI